LRGLIEALNELSKLFPKVPRPALNLGCERSCPEASSCNSLGCYRNGVINLKSGVGVDVLVHEYGHHVFHTMASNHVDPIACERFANAFERSLIDRVLCERCGYTIIHDDREGVCLYCGEAYVKDSKPSSLDTVAKGLVIGISGALLGGFVAGLIPMPEEPREVKMEKARKLLGVAAVTSLLSVAGYSI